MEFSDKDSLKRILSLPNIGSEKFVIFRNPNYTFTIMTIKDYENFMRLDNWQTEINIVIYNGANLYVDIDTKSVSEWNKAVDACNRFVKRCMDNSAGDTYYPILTGSEPTSLHLHVCGLWFNFTKDIPAFLRKNGLRIFDPAVYKENAQMRVGLCLKKGSLKKYSIVNCYGKKYNHKNIIKLLTPTIPMKGLTQKIYKYIYKQPKESFRINKITIEKVEDLLTRHGIVIQKYSLNSRGFYIIPQKPWNCPMCSRSHTGNNIVVTSKGEMRCFQNSF